MGYFAYDCVCVCVCTGVHAEIKGRYQVFSSTAFYLIPLRQHLSMVLVKQSLSCSNLLVSVPWMDDGINACPHCYEASFLKHEAVSLTLVLDLYQELQWTVDMVPHICNPNPACRDRLTN